MKLYLDYNASTPLDPRLLDTMTECLSGIAGNPSSTYQFGRAARARLDTAREQVAALVGAHASQVIFTSGGTEANNLAFRALSWGRQAGRLAVSSIEHPSVLEPARGLADQGWQLDVIEVDEHCRVTPEALSGFWCGGGVGQNAAPTASCAHPSLARSSGSRAGPLP